MPNHQCQRCERRICRVSCSQCSFHVCEDCRLIVKKLHVCTACYNRRIIPIVSAIVNIRVDNYIWATYIRSHLEDIYTKAGSPFGIQLQSGVVREFVRSEQTPLCHGIRDRYIRIGKHYTAIRSISNQNGHHSRNTIKLYISDEMKEELAAKSMHPDRLQYWMDKGWEEEWDDYF